MIKHCIWLTLDSIELFQIVEDFAIRFKSPIFQPHITLIGRTDQSMTKLKSAIIGIRDRISINEVEVENIGISDNYWKSYYLELKDKQKLIEIYKMLCHNLSINSDINYSPHISLMYNNISKDIKQKIELPIKIGTRFKIESIQITECDNKVEYWKPVCELKL